MTHGCVVGEEIIAYDSDDDTPLSVSTIASLLSQNAPPQVGAREAALARFAQLGGVFRALSRGASLSLWTLYETPKTPLSGSETPAFTLSPAERSAAEWLAKDTNGAYSALHECAAEAEWSPAAIYSAEKEHLCRRRKRKRAEVESTARVIDFGEETEESLEKLETSVASAVMRCYNARTRQRLAQECLAIPY